MLSNTKIRPHPLFIKLFFILAFLITGCTRVHLAPNKPQKLPNFVMQTSSFPLRWNPSSAGQTAVGYQFVGPLPLGIIGVESVGLHFYAAVKAKLIERGLQLTTTTEQTAPSISMKSLSLNAYDLFFTRRLVCHAQALLDHAGHQQLLRTSFIDYHQLAFEEQLSLHLHRCLVDLAEQLVDRL